MTAPPAISVVIAARDAARFLPATLAALQAQEFADFEAVLIDDHSRDRTARIVEDVAANDDRFRTAPATGRGVSAARNQGMAETTAPLVLFLDADDLLIEDALGRLHGRLERSQAIGALGGIRRIDETGAPLPGDDNRALVPQGDQLRALLEKNFIVNGGALLLRRGVVEAAGGYDARLTYGEDWEFWCRVCETGELAILDGTPVLLYRQVGTGANFTARLGFFARDIPCLDAIARRPSLAARYGGALRRLVRARRIDIFWAAVRSEFQHGRKATAVLVAIGGLVYYPDSVLRPRLALRFLKSLRR